MTLNVAFFLVELHKCMLQSHSHIHSGSCYLFHRNTFPMQQLLLCTLSFGITQQQHEAEDAQTRNIVIAAAVIDEERTRTSRSAVGPLVFKLPLHVHELQ